MRLSSESLEMALIDGILDQGANVISIGMVSTDQFYFACATEKLPGLMVTASHNPKQYNGFKMVKEMPYLLSGDSGIQDIRRIAEKAQFRSPRSRGKLTKRSYLDSFIEKVFSIVDISTIRPMNVVADTANGMVGPILDEIHQRLPLKLTRLYFEPDGNLPNHGLDPLQPQNRAVLERTVIEQRAEIGFAYDGDGDRFFAVDDRGRFVPGDFLTAIIANYLLERDPGSKIIYDVRASWAVPDTIRNAGGESLKERVGHAFIKRRMAEESALFAGEVTGHYYFRSFFSADSGILPSLLLLQLLSQKEMRLSELLSPLEERYFLSGEINTKVENVQSRMDLLRRRFSDGKLSTLDGISIDYPDWHFNVRPSNTEPLLRLNLESYSFADRHGTSS